MQRYWQCLSQPYALSLLATNLLGRLPSGMGALAIVLFLRSLEVSYERVGAAVAVYGVCSAVGGPLLGRYVDRYGQPLTLLAGAIGSGAGFVVLASLGASSFVAALVGVGVAGFFMPPLEPALRGLWPSVLPDSSTLQVAYALDTALQNLLFIAGPLLAVGLVALTSTTTALYVIAVVNVVGTVAYVAHRPVRAWLGEQRIRDWAGPLRSRQLLVLLVSLLSLGGVVGVLNVTTVAYSEQIGLPEFSGVLLGAFSLGSLVGGLVYGAQRWTSGPVRQLTVLLVGMAVCTWPLVVVAPPAVTVGILVITGLWLAPVLTCCFLLIGKIAPAGTTTEAFAWVTAVFLGGSAAGSAVAGAVLPRADLGGAFAMAGLFATGALLVVVLAARTPALSGRELR